MRGPLINSTIVLRKWWNPADRLIPSVLIGRRNGGWQEKKVERDPVVESPPQLRPMYLYSRSGCLWAIHQRKYGREKKEKQTKTMIGQDVFVVLVFIWHSFWYIERNRNWQRLWPSSLVVVSFVFGQRERSITLNYCQQPASLCTSGGSCNDSVTAWLRVKRKKKRKEKKERPQAAFQLFVSLYHWRWWGARLAVGVVC